MVSSMNSGLPSVTSMRKSLRDSGGVLPMSSCAKAKQLSGDSGSRATVKASAKESLASAISFHPGAPGSIREVNRNRTRECSASVMRLDSKAADDASAQCMSSQTITVGRSLEAAASNRLKDSTYRFRRDSGSSSSGRSSEPL